MGFRVSVQGFGVWEVLGVWEKGSGGFWQHHTTTNPENDRNLTKKFWPEGWPEGWGAQNFAFFSFSHTHFHSFLSLVMFSCLLFSLRVSFSSLWRSSRGILVLFWSVGTSNGCKQLLDLNPTSPPKKKRSILAPLTFLNVKNNAGKHKSTKKSEPSKKMCLFSPKGCRVEVPGGVTQTTFSCCIGWVSSWREA